jgi:hypothetical protein
VRTIKGLVFGLTAVVAAALIAPDAGAQTVTYMTPDAAYTTVQASLQTALNATNAQLTQYGKQVRAKGNEQTAFDSSMIALATGSVVAAFAHASLPTIGGFAIGSNGLSAYRSYYDPEGEGAAYLKAEKSLRCISTTASPFVNADIGGVLAAVGDLQTKMDEVSAAASNLSGTDPKTTAASEAATKALSAAKTAQAALVTESQAYNQLPSVVQSGNDIVAGYVEIKNHRSIIDVTSVQASLNAGIQAAATSAAQTLTAASKLQDALAAQQKAQTATNDSTTHQDAPTVAAPSSLTAALVSVQSRVNFALALKALVAPRPRQVIAFSDPSDMLTFDVPKLLNPDGSEAAIVVNVYDRNEINWFGLLVNPVKAHTGHSGNQRVLRLMFAP